MTDPRFDDKPLAMLRRVGRESLARKMTDLFLGSAAGRVAAIAAAHAAGDLPTVGRTAHSLKPSAGQLGAVALQSVCQEIEEAATIGDVAAVGALLPRLAEEFSATDAWLRAGTSAPSTE
ncbi:MAG: Hpt domain-containing protein [Gemmatimonadaceae bacterium]